MRCANNLPGRLASRPLFLQGPGLAVNKEGLTDQQIAQLTYPGMPMGNCPPVRMTSGMGVFPRHLCSAPGWVGDREGMWVAASLAQFWTRHCTMLSSQVMQPLTSINGSSTSWDAYTNPAHL